MTTYYVKTGGSDVAAGTSDSTAWATLSKVRSVSLQPGDSVLFRRGDSWACANDDAGLVFTGRQGTSGNVITFGAYGTGAADPIIGTAAATTRPMQIKSGCAYLTFEYLDLRGGMSMIRPETANITNITYNYCKFGQTPDHSVRGVFWYCPSSYKANYITFANCTFASGLAAATGEQPSGEAMWVAGGDYLVVHDCTFTGWSHDCINIIPTGTLTCQNFDIYENTFTGDDVTYCRAGDFQAQNNVNQLSGGKFRDNTISHVTIVDQLCASYIEYTGNTITDKQRPSYWSAAEKGPGGIRLAGYLGLAVKNNTISGNYWQNLGGSAIDIDRTSLSRGDVYDNVITGNTFENCGRDTASTFYGIGVALRTWYGATLGANTFTDNVFVDTSYSDVVTYRAVDATKTSSKISVATFNTSDTGGDVISGNTYNLTPPDPPDPPTPPITSPLCPFRKA